MKRDAPTWTILVFSAVSCAESPTIAFATLADDCENQCHILTSVCDYIGPPSAEMAKSLCVEECIDWKDDALAHSYECARSYEDMMTCVGQLTSCEEIKSWGKREGAFPCSDESMAFDRFCEGFL